MKSSSFIDKDLNHPVKKPVSIAPNKSKPEKGSTLKSEFDFESAILEYGKASLPFLKEQDFSRFDPLVSDWACQLRAYWLLKLLKDHPTLDNLSEEQLKALGMYRLLTESIVQEKDALGMILSQVTNIKFHPSTWNISNSKMQEIYLLAKQRVASLVIKSLIDDVKNSSIPHKDLILQRLKEPIYTKFSGASLNVIEFFSGCLAILELAIEHNIPIAVELKQFKYENTQYSLDAAHTLVYCPVNEKFVGSDLNNNLEKSALVFHMYSGLSDTDPLQSDFLNLNDPDKFWNKVKEIDVTSLILAIAATHPQFSPQAFLLKDNEPKPLADILKYEDNLTTLYEQHLNKGKQEKLGIIPYFTKGVGFFQKQIPLNVDHVCIGKVKHVKDEQEDFALSCKNKFESMK